MSFLLPAATPEQPISTTIVPDWEAAETYLAEHAGDHARNLTALTALVGEECHQIVLDPETRTIWWAWDCDPGSPTDEAGWSVDHLSPLGAAQMLDGHIGVIEDRFADPEQYCYGNNPDSDQDVMDEFAAILRLALPASPAEAGARITRELELIARWQRTYAALVRELSGTEPGGTDRASHALGISKALADRLIGDDDQHRADLADAVQEARQSRCER